MNDLQEVINMAAALGKKLEEMKNPSEKKYYTFESSFLGVQRFAVLYGKVTEGRDGVVVRICNNRQSAKLICSILNSERSRLEC